MERRVEGEGLEVATQWRERLAHGRPGLHVDPPALPIERAEALRCRVGVEVNGMQMRPGRQ